MRKCRAKRGIDGCRLPFRGFIPHQTRPSKNITKDASCAVIEASETTWRDFYIAAADTRVRAGIKQWFEYGQLADDAGELACAAEYVRWLVLGTWWIGGLVAQLTDLRAVRMTSVTASGWEIMMTCEPSISVILAPARCAIDRTMSLPAALSAVPTAGQDGRSFQAGCLVSSANALAAMGRWDRPYTSDSS